MNETVSKMENVGDAISRQAAIDKFKPWLEVRSYGWGELNMLRAVINELENMPPVQPKHGKWRTKNIACVVLDVCDQCMKGVKHVAPFYDYCPHCGAKMER